jgi:ubiquitin-conjugating enzyme E2 J2
MKANNRLMLEHKLMLKRPSLGNFVALPEPDNIYEWHYCIFNLKDCPYEGGFYHGKLIFPKEFPWKPPSILMLTPSGRFETLKRICTSFSDYHPEQWNPAWTVESILVGFVSFMTTEDMTVGGVRSPDF